MAIVQGFSALDIMTLREVRDAGEAGAGVAALTPSLDDVLWANAAGRSLLGLGGGAGSGWASLPAARQIRAAARVVATRGEARLLLRPATGLAARPVMAEIRRGAARNQPFVILTIMPARPAAANRAELARQLLGDAGLADAAICDATGLIVSGSLDGAGALAADIAALIHSGAGMTVVERGGRRTLLAQVASGLVLVRDEAMADAPSAPPEGPGEPAAAPIDAEAPLPARTAGLFSVKRRRLPPGRGGRMTESGRGWPTRGIGEAASSRLRPTGPRSEEATGGPEGALPMAARGGEISAAAEEDVMSRLGLDPAEHGASLIGPHPISAADASPEAEPTASPAAPKAPTTRPFRSRWGTGPSVDANASDGPDRVASPTVPLDPDATEAAPTDEPAGPAGETAQPVERESVVILPDLPEERAADLDPPISEDASAPAGEGEGAVDGAGAGLPGDSLQDFVPRFDIAPVRFVWQIDRAGQFRALSPEFAAAVGPKAADVLGRSFREVAEVFGFDAGGEIARLLDRRDTWSGRSILWPVEGSARKVPVDLAALPVYARDRSFDGFRGFGILRMNDATADADAIGVHLARGAFEGEARRTTIDAPPVEGGPDADHREPGAGDAAAMDDKPFLTTFEPDAHPARFGRRAEPPRLQEDAPETVPATEGPAGSDGEDPPKVIRLEERRRPKDAALSQAEEAAFRAIGAKLGQQSEAESPGALRFGDRRRRDDEGFGEAAGPELHEGDPVEAPDAGDPSPPSPAPASDRPEPAGPEGGTPPFASAVSSSPADSEAPSADAAGNVDRSADDVLSAQALSAVKDAPLLADARDPSPEGTATGPAETTTDEGASLAPGGRGAPESVSGPMAADLDAIFGSLPLPILLQVRESLVYRNQAFTDLTGYHGIPDLEARGGLGSLFVEPKDGPTAGDLAIRRADGEVLDVRVHLQRIAFPGRSCLLMSFSPSPGDALPAAPPLIGGGEAREAGAGADAAQDDLRQQVEELQAVLDTATDGVVLLDSAGTIRTMNGSALALFGIGQDDPVGRHLSSLFAQESQKAVVDYLEMLKEEGLAGILNDGREVIGRVAQGGFIPLFITIGRLSGERGWCVVIRDIAHWKRIEEDLVNARRQAEAASLHKSRFLANISHELRTPLNAIIGFADVMASECFGPIGNERYLEYLGDIKRSGHHVLDLVNDLLDISKIEAGKLDLAFEAVSLNEVVSEVVSLMQPQANRERVIVRSNLPASVPPVVADRRTMRQIALNLVANAIRFTPAGGQIIASTTYTAEGDVLLRFRDSGIGMTEREIEIALTPFQQVHAPSANRGEGTGLGLPLTKAMVEANRAHFTINSTPGEGTLVEIAFPSQRVLAD